MVEVEPRKLLRLDQHLRLIGNLGKLVPQREISFAEGTRDDLLAAVPSGSGKLSIQSMFTYAFTRDEIFSCSDLRLVTDGKETWSSAIVRFPIDAPGSFKVFKASPHTSPEWTFCRVGFPYVATIEETGFVILLGDQTGLYRNDPDSDSLTRLTAYPEDHLAAPLFPEFSSAGEFAAAMAEVEKSTMPVGLYAWSDHLFLLRRVVDSGGARFLLDKVSPANGQVIGTAELRTEAKELLLVPGEQWAMVEKLKFVSPRLPRIAQIRLIPGAAFGDGFGGVLCD